MLVKYKYLMILKVVLKMLPLKTMLVKYKFISDLAEGLKRKNFKNNAC